MIYLKSNPVGIDVQIQNMQEYLYEKLNISMNCDIYAYGRAYIEDRESVKPIVYLNDGEYREVLHDDTVRGLHYFFIEGDSADVLSNTCMSSNDVSVIVIVNDITKAKPSISHYADEEIKEEVKSYLTSFFEAESVVKGKDALDGFDISQVDFIYPFFVFRITGKINNY